ncbi:MAG TPA: magnesium transporter, partial [Thermomicrobiales bacterium]|nr:magnesium transporter [Thermomicrobiales bacterium]
AADILDEMEPNDAADLLADLPEAQAASLLERMEPDEAADVRELLAYEEDTAAGLMTTEFVTAPPATTAGDALTMIRALPEPPNPLYHVYLVGPDDRWLGVASLRDIVLAPPATPLAAIAMPDYRAATQDEDPRTAAHTMAEYNLSDLPVLDDDGRLLGIILIDDAMDALYPDLWRRRLANTFR